MIISATNKDRGILCAILSLRRKYSELFLSECIIIYSFLKRLINVFSFNLCSEWLWIPIYMHFYVVNGYVHLDESNLVIIYTRWEQTWWFWYPVIADLAFKKDTRFDWSSRSPRVWECPPPSGANSQARYQHAHYLHKNKWQNDFYYHKFKIKNKIEQWSIRFNPNRRP